MPTKQKLLLVKELKEEAIHERLSELIMPIEADNPSKRKKRKVDKKTGVKRTRKQ